MLICYLDDSGKDPQNSITTIAGYVATAEKWAEFEASAEPIFNGYQIGILHAANLEGGRGEFKNWTLLRKQAFVARICRAMSGRVLLGMSVSALKDKYKSRATESGRKRTVTPYTFCSNLIIDWLLTDIRVGRLAHSEGVALVLERGHENNAEANQNFYDVRQLHGLDNVLRSITFAKKESCRAIQMADLFAYYSRRHGVAAQQAVGTERTRVLRNPGAMLNIITESNAASCVYRERLRSECVRLPFLRLLIRTSFKDVLVSTGVSWFSSWMPFRFGRKAQ